MEEELKNIREKQRNALASLATFTAEDFEALKLASASPDPETPSTKALFHKYYTYLRGAVERFERGTVKTRCFLTFCTIT